MCSLRYRSYDGYNYDPSYTSHSHGWSSGPTSALTFYVLGLQVVDPMGQSWSLAPHTSGLSGAEGGFETPLGWFGASWSLSNNGKEMTIDVDTPEGTSGTVTVPGNVGKNVKVDGEMIKVDDALRTVKVQGGKRTITLA